MPGEREANAVFDQRPFEPLAESSNLSALMGTANRPLHYTGMEWLFVCHKRAAEQRLGKPLPNAGAARVAIEEDA